MGNSTHAYTARSSAAITLSVWKALFLREALSRLAARRAIWFWLLAEPVFHVTCMLVVYTAIRLSSVGGVNTVVWLIMGMVGFFVFRRTATQVTNAITANRALFAYRQVKPIDALLMRAVLEGLLMLVIGAILLGGAALFGHSVIPADPLAVLQAFFGMWLLGLAYGMVSSVAVNLVPDLGNALNIIMTPLYMISGVIVPLNVVPQPYRDWLLLNPLAHGLEAVRLAFSPYYHAVEGLSMAYLYGFALVALFLGLALQHRFALRLRTQ